MGDGQYYRGRPREGAPYAVQAAPRDADAAERELASAGRCNWITGYGAGFREYCGERARVCTAHAPLVASVLEMMEDLWN